MISTYSLCITSINGTMNRAFFDMFDYFQSSRELVVLCGGNIRLYTVFGLYKNAVVDLNASK